MSNLESLLTNLENDFHELLQKHSKLIQTEFDQYLNEIDNLKGTIQTKDQTISEMREKLDKANFEEENYQNFSLVSNLSKQITEKELEIKKYQAQLRIASKTIQDLQTRIDSEHEEAESIQEDKQDNSVRESLPEDTGAEADGEESLEEQSPEELEEELEEEEPEEKELEEEEIEIQLTKRKIKGVYYYVSDEDPPLIYECLENDEAGEDPIGEKKGRKSIFYDDEKK